MKPVIVQNLIRSMRKRIKLPETTPSEIPTRKDRSGQFMIIFAVLVIISMFLI